MDGIGVFGGVVERHPAPPKLRRTRPCRWMQSDSRCRPTCSLSALDETIGKFLSGGHYRVYAPEPRGSPLSSRRSLK